MPTSASPIPHQTAWAVIPARFASTRLPGKPLLDATGKPLIQHVIDQVRQAKLISRIVVATDDARIAEAVDRFGGEAMLTRDDHPNGTSRIAEVMENLSVAAPEIIVNVQGDEPEIEPGIVDALIQGLTRDAQASMATIASPFAPHEYAANPNIVKVVVDQQNRALYFSRSLIPFDRDGRHITNPLKHVGIYAYRKPFLSEYAALPPTPLEQSEQLEQLRVLEHGHKIAVIVAKTTHHGIDTPDQYAAFVKRRQVMG